MPLSATAVRNAKPRAKPFKLYDAAGLFLLVQPSGNKWWRFKYRWLNKEKLLSLGTYPDVSLADARERLAETRKVLAAGNDPSEAKKETKRQVAINHENSFEAIAREWHASRSAAWTARYAGFLLKRLEADVFPKLGSRPISAINAPELLSVLRVIEKRGALEMAQRAMQTCSQIFMFAIATSRAKDNPANNLKGALKTPKKKHYAHLEAVDLPEFFQKVEAYDGNIQTKLALKLLVLTFVRTSELRGMQWSEIDFDKAEWRIPAERMKMRTAHIVPLSSQSIEILKEMKKYTGNWEYVFPNQFKPIKCMSESGLEFYFTLHQVVLDTDEDGDPVTSCVVEHQDAAFEDCSKPKGKWRLRVYEAVCELIGVSGTSVSLESVISKAIKGEAYDAGPDPKKPNRDRRRDNAMRAVKELHDDEMIVFEGDSISFPQSHETPQSG